MKKIKEPRIALIHATPLAMAPVNTVFASRWPQAECLNLLDDRLSPDLARAGAITGPLVQRFVRLAHYAKDQGACGILFTCSAFGPAIEAARISVGLPTLKPNEAMFEEALALCARLGGTRRVGLITTFAPAERPMCEEFEAAARRCGAAVHLSSVCAPDALPALNAGDAARHDALVLAQARALAGCDVLMLGQFSMARTQPAVADATGVPVLTSPDSAVRSLQHRLCLP
jgi:Asp/Glu/hydantoin racemase